MKAPTLVMVTLLAAAGCGPASDSMPPLDALAPQTRDDVALMTVPSAGVSVDVLANDTSPDGTALQVIEASTSTAGADVRVAADSRIEVRPPSGFKGTIEVDYRAAHTSGGKSSLGLLTVYVDSWFDGLLTSLEQGAVGQRMLDAFDADGQAPFEPQLVFVIKHRERVVMRRIWGGLTETTPVPMASASKWMATALMLRARDEGRVSLDDPLVRWLPGFSSPQLDGTGPQRSAVTLRQAFSMSHGLNTPHRYHTLRTLTHDQSVERIRYSPESPGNGFTTGPVLMKFNPGTYVGYDGKAMHVGGRAVLEAYAGQYDWLTFAKAKLFEPCGMSSTTWDEFYPANPAVAGGVITTANDYLTFLDMIHHGGMCGATRLLSAASIEDLFSYHLKPADGAHPRTTPIWESPWPNCSTAPFAGGGAPVSCARWLDGTDTGGTFYENGNDNLRYALGAWVLSEKDGVIESLTSPGAYGTAPWIDRKREARGVFLTRVDAGGYGDPAAPKHFVAELYLLRQVRERLDALLSDPRADVAPAVDL